MAEITIESLVSDLPDMGNLPLDGDAISAAECWRAVGLIGISSDELGTPVSAFNSSI